jgi:hypothetical protein
VISRTHAGAARVGTGGGAGQLPGQPFGDAGGAVACASLGDSGLIVFGEPDTVLRAGTAITCRRKSCNSNGEKRNV